MIEKDIEKYLRMKVKKEFGGIALKFISPGFNGVPDRIILVPFGHIYFVETKAPGKKLRRLQEWVCSMFRNLGFEVYRLDTIEKVNTFIEVVRGDFKGGV